jgi:hypothetical protein
MGGGRGVTIRGGYGGGNTRRCGHARAGQLSMHTQNAHTECQHKTPTQHANTVPAQYADIEIPAQNASTACQHSCPTPTWVRGGDGWRGASRRLGSRHTPHHLARQGVHGPHTHRHARHGHGTLTDSDGHTRPHTTNTPNTPNTLATRVERIVRRDGGFKGSCGHVKKARQRRGGTTSKHHAKERGARGWGAICRSHQAAANLGNVQHVVAGKGARRNDGVDVGQRLGGKGLVGQARGAAQGTEQGVQGVGGVARRQAYPESNPATGH